MSEPRRMVTVYESAFLEMEDRISQLEAQVKAADELAHAVDLWKTQVEAYGGDYHPEHAQLLFGTLAAYRKARGPV